MSDLRDKNDQPRNGLLGGAKRVIIKVGTSVVTGSEGQLFLERIEPIAMGGTVGELGQMGLQIGAQGLMLKYSRSDEAQADAVGTIILYKAGYNPQAMAD